MASAAVMTITKWSISGDGGPDMPMPLIPDIAVFQRKLATLPLATYQAGRNRTQRFSGA
jgi:hypothetical protein